MQKSFPRRFWQQYGALLHKNGASQCILPAVHANVVAHPWNALRPFMMVFCRSYSTAEQGRVALNCARARQLPSDS